MTLLLAIGLVSTVVERASKIFIEPNFDPIRTCENISYFSNKGTSFELDALEYNMAL